MISFLLDKVEKSGHHAIMDDISDHSDIISEIDDESDIVKGTSLCITISYI